MRLRGPSITTFLAKAEEKLTLLRTRWPEPDSDEQFDVAFSQASTDQCRFIPQVSETLGNFGQPVLKGIGDGCEPATKAVRETLLGNCGGIHAIIDNVGSGSSKHGELAGALLLLTEREQDVREQLGVQARTLLGVDRRLHALECRLHRGDVVLGSTKLKQHGECPASECQNGSGGGSSSSRAPVNTKDLEALCDQRLSSIEVKVCQRIDDLERNLRAEATRHIERAVSEHLEGLLHAEGPWIQALEARFAERVQSLEDRITVLFETLCSKELADAGAADPRLSLLEGYVADLLEASKTRVLEQLKEFECGASSRGVQEPGICQQLEAAPLWVVDEETSEQLQESERPGQLHMDETFQTRLCEPASVPQPEDVSYIVETILTPQDLEQWSCTRAPSHTIAEATLLSRGELPCRESKDAIMRLAVGVQDPVALIKGRSPGKFSPRFNGNGQCLAVAVAKDDEVERIPGTQGENSSISSVPSQGDVTAATTISLSRGSASLTSLGGHCTLEAAEPEEEGRIESEDTGFTDIPETTMGAERAPLEQLGIVGNDGVVLARSASRASSFDEDSKTCTSSLSKRCRESEEEPSIECNNCSEYSSRPDSPHGINEAEVTCSARQVSLAAAAMMPEATTICVDKAADTKSMSSSISSPGIISKMEAPTLFQTKVFVEEQEDVMFMHSRTSPGLLQTAAAHREDAMQEVTTLAEVSRLDGLSSAPGTPSAAEITMLGEGVEAPSEREAEAARTVQAATFEPPPLEVWDRFLAGLFEDGSTGERISADTPRRPEHQTIGNTVGLSAANSSPSLMSTPSVHMRNNCQSAGSACEASSGYSWAARRAPGGLQAVNVFPTIPRIAHDDEAFSEAWRTPRRASSDPFVGGSPLRFSSIPSPQSNEGSVCELYSRHATDSAAVPHFTTPVSSWCAANCAFSRSPSSVESYMGNSHISGRRGSDCNVADVSGASGFSSNCHRAMSWPTRLDTPTRSASLRAPLAFGTPRLPPSEAESHGSVDCDWRSGTV